MASKKRTEKKTEEKGYQPKATARHAKITKTKEEEIVAFRNKMNNDKHLAKKYEDNRRTEIRAMPKEDRAAAKAELKEAISKRKEAERNDKKKLNEMILDEKLSKKGVEREPFNEDAWVNSGRKKKNKSSEEAPIIESDVPEESVEEPSEPNDVDENVPVEDADIPEGEDVPSEDEEEKS